jgi:hypothetical protein
MKRGKEKVAVRYRTMETAVGHVVINNRPFTSSRPDRVRWPKQRIDRRALSFGWCIGGGSEVDGVLLVASQAAFGLPKDH